MRKFILSVLLLIMTTAYASTFAEEEPMRTVVYPIVYGDPVALETISRSIVGDEGHVVLDAKGSRLIVVTTPSRHQQLDEILGEADAKTGNVQINVHFRKQSTSRDRGFSLQGGGHVIVQDGNPSGTIVVQPKVHDVLAESSGDTHQMLLVASGREGFIKVGEQVPYIEWISEYGWHGGYTETKLQWQEVGSFLVVTPTIMSDGKTVHIKLTPELRGQVDGNPLQVKFTALTTEVMVQDGMTMPLGGFGENQDFYSRFLIGMNRSGVQSSLDIELTPRILHPTGP